MGFVGRKPTNAPLTSSDLGTGIVGSTNIADGTIVNDDINASAAIAVSKLTGTLPVANGGTGLTALGTASQELRVNSGATALEYYTPTVVSSDYVLLATTTASNVASVSFDGYFSSTYDNYKVIAYDTYPSTSTNKELYVRLRRGNADVTAGNYRYASGGRRSFSGGDDTTGGGSWNESFFSTIAGYGYGSSSGDFVHGREFVIYNPLSTSTYKMVNWFGAGYDSVNGVNVSHTGSGILADSTSALSGITFYMNSGNINGKFKLYGIK